MNIFRANLQEIVEVRGTQPGKQSCHGPSLGWAALLARLSQLMQNQTRHVKICRDETIAHDKIKSLRTELILKNNCSFKIISI